MEAFKEYRGIERFSYAFGPSEIVVYDFQTYFMPLRAPLQEFAETVLNIDRRDIKAQHRHPDRTIAPSGTKLHYARSLFEIKSLKQKCRTHEEKAGRPRATIHGNG